MDNKIILTIDNQAKEVSKNTRLEEIAKEYNNDDIIVAAIVENDLKELTYEVQEDANIEFIRLSSSIGNRIYQRSLSFLFIRACLEVFSGSKVFIEHSIGKGLFCEVKYKRDLEEEDLLRIKKRMKEIVDENVPFIKKRVPLDEAKEIFKYYTQEGKEKLLKYREKPYLNIYECGWIKNYFYGYMVPSTSYLSKFDLVKYKTGLILMSPNPYNIEKGFEFEEQPKLFNVLRESEKWGEILGVDYVASLNDLIVLNKESEFIRVAEALHEKKVAQISDLITEKIDEKKIILIAGPTSSGKTTFTERLKVQLKVNGLEPVSISVDDYFVNREDTPLDENGEYNFEDINAIDIELFNKDLSKLLKGEEVELPKFNFHLGKREYIGRKLSIKSNQPILLEGIHCLNEKLTRDINKKNKFKIYISALTQLNIDEHNRIPTTDTRLIRRLVRDHKFRSNNAEKTLELWPSVRRGEEANIFPYQEEADIMFNSALFYELCVLKKYAEPLIRQVPSDSKYYAEAKRLLKFLSYFMALEEEKSIPNNSILKEFIGGSCFEH